MTAHVKALLDTHLFIGLGAELLFENTSLTYSSLIIGHLANNNNLGNSNRPRTKHV